MKRTPMLANAIAARIFVGMLNDSGMFNANAPKVEITIDDILSMVIQYKVLFI
jgi:hypothetical protein